MNAGQLSRDDYRDAIAWMYAVFNGDVAGKNAIARGCDAAGLVEALSTLFGGLAIIATEGKPLEYLDFVRDHIDDVLDAEGLPR